MNYTTVQPASLDFNSFIVTSYLSEHHYPWFSANPSLPLTGTAIDNQWYSERNDNEKTSFIMKYNAPFTAKRIYYENSHSFGKLTYNGWKEVSLWGANVEINSHYDTHANQTLIWEGTFNIHKSEDVEDPQYVLLDNSIPYSYYFFRIKEPWLVALATYIGIRRIALQVEA